MVEVTRTLNCREAFIKLLDQVKIVVEVMLKSELKLVGLRVKVMSERPVSEGHDGECATSKLGQTTVEL